MVDPHLLDRISDEAGAWREVSGSPAQGPEAEAIAMLGRVIATQLTQRQKEIVDLYFYQGRTQTEIAEILGIQQQVVSRQLFGALRKGRRVGGAIRKLRKVLEAQGIHLGDGENGGGEKER
jgi:RNA polymerase sigma factor (sigma-70 family)